MAARSAAIHLLVLICPNTSDYSYSNPLGNSHYKNRFFESLPMVDFQKTDFGVSSAFGAGNTKIGFIMIIAGTTAF